MHYVYILSNNRDDIYIGLTSDLDRRLNEHNSGKVNATRLKMPWNIESFTAFLDKEKAVDFERYLKTGSGRAFLRKHLI